MSRAQPSCHRAGRAHVLACACALLAASACGTEKVSLGSDRSLLNAGAGAGEPQPAGDQGESGLGGMFSIPTSGTGGGEPPPFDAGQVMRDASEPDTSLGRPCGTGHPACAGSEICEYPSGTDCDSVRQEGVCAAIPDTCMSEVAPMCGCDAMTYPNACAAALFGVVIDHEGSCEPQPEACGGASGASCVEGEFCDRAGSCSGEGVCRQVPSMCRREPRPVCGCDSVTYENICQAAARGVSAAYLGPCGGGGPPPMGMPCGGPAATGCPVGQFCDFTRGDGCDVPEAGGYCMLIPSFCYFLYSPVCGCDGVTYENPCFSATASASLRHPGPCP